DAVAAGAVRPDLRHRQPADPRGSAGELGTGCPAVPVHRRDVAGVDRRSGAAVGGSLAALGITHADVDAGHRRGIQPVSAQRRARSQGAGVMTDTAALHAKSGLETPEFASRRTLVLRRFLRRPSAVAALIVLLVLFVGCYTVPSLLPYSYSDLDFNALLQPPN